MLIKLLNKAWYIFIYDLKYSPNDIVIIYKLLIVTLTRVYINFILAIY
jgi:hypothetical protein